MKVMHNIGMSPTAIADKMGKGHGTVIKYLNSDVYTDPDIEEMVKKISKNELNDLYLLGAKGRYRLHEMLDEGKLQMIPTIALVDRTFQQRRLLEDLSTNNFSHRLTGLIERATANREGTPQEDKGQGQVQP